MPERRPFTATAPCGGCRASSRPGEPGIDTVRCSAGDAARGPPQGPGRSRLRRILRRGVRLRRRQEEEEEAEEEEAVSAFLDSMADAVGALEDAEKAALFWPGQSVQALRSFGRLEDCTITKRNPNGTYAIAFADGVTMSTVEESKISMYLSLIHI